MPAAPLETLTMQPPPREWRIGAPVERAGLSRGALGAFRAELGLRAGPVVMSGHQAELWHPGILAKYFATVAAARAMGASPAWVVVDQDTGAPERIAFPALNWSRKVWALAPERDDARPLCARGAIAPGAVPTGAMCGAVGETLEALRGALARGAGESSIARQFTRVVFEWLAPLGPAPGVIFAGDVARTGLFAEFVDRMRADHARCVRAYNSAASRHPNAGVRALREGPNAELPLWSLSRTGARGPCFVESAPGGLLPRALTLTALLRLAGCELFVHGLGGGVYDRITDEWLREWLGVELSPTVVVSATCFPRPIGAPEPPDAAGAARARWLAHRAMHDPAVLGDGSLARRKRELFERVGSLAGPERRAAYAAMHELLTEYRAHNRARLEELASDAHARAESARAGKGAWDRTWPFVFLAPAQVRELRDRVGLAFKGEVPV